MHILYLYSIFMTDLQKVAMLQNGLMGESELLRPCPQHPLCEMHSLGKY